MRALHFVVSAFLLMLPLSACGPDEASGAARWAGSVDTLPSGAVVVTNPATGLWTDETRWRVEEELRIGTLEGTGPDLFGQITDIAVDPAGRIWVLEGQSQEIRVFGETGAHIRTIGRKGGGPGEFNQAAALDWGPDGHLWVVDPRNNRISVLDTAGTLVRSHTTIGGFMIFPWPGGFDDAGHLYSPAPLRSEEGFRSGLVRHDTTMTPIDTIHPPRYTGPAEFFELRSDRGSMRAGVPFSPGLRSRLHPDGKFWALSTGDYTLLEIALTGDTLRIISRTFEPLPVTEADVEAAIEGMEWFISQGGKVDRGKFPDVKPPVTNFVVDDEDNIWVVRQRERDDATLVDVFDPDGRYLGELTLPFATSWGRTPAFRDGLLYTVTTDDLEVPYVVRVRIVKP